MSLTELIESPAPDLNPMPATLARPGVKRDPKTKIPTDIVTGDVPEAKAQDEYVDRVRKSCKVDIPEGYELVLVEAWFNEKAWTRKSKDQENAVSRPAWRYRFKVEKVSAVEKRKSLSEMESWLRNHRVKNWQAAIADPLTPAGHAEVVVLADLQIGKVDERGGTEELQQRFYQAIEEVKTRLGFSKPQTIVIAEVGDGCENFENTPTQAHTNDRNLVAQLDLHQEFLFHAIKELAHLAPNVIVVGVPSNHMEVRKDGKAVGGPENDFGLLSLAAMKRAFALRPDLYGHVSFHWPDAYEVSIVLPVAGQNIGFTHGHYARGAGAADNVPKWLANQFAAKISRLDEATIIVTGHFHHLILKQIIGSRWWIQAPALDNGSAWLKRVNGQGASDAGILTFRVDQRGWSDIEILGNTSSL